jgi:hypothetical protein
MKPAYIVGQKLFDPKRDITWEITEITIGNSGKPFYTLKPSTYVCVFFQTELDKMLVENMEDSE